MYDLRGHEKSHKVILKFENHLFLRNIVGLMAYLFKTFQLFKNYEEVNFSVNEA